MSSPVEGILHPLHLRELAKQWILEDTGSFDISGSVVGQQIASFGIIFKETGMLAGVPFANAVFQEMDLRAEWLYKEGDFVPPFTVAARIVGRAKLILLAERIVLNILSRASGIATYTFKLVSMLREARWKGRLAGTRKTTPGFRMVEKYAVSVGGADMHRYDLSGMIMLKDNHITINGSISKAIANAKANLSFTQKIEVECQSLHEALEAATAGCDIIMLDNFTVQNLHTAAEELKRKYPHILIEASGGVTIQNIVQFASSSIDIISSSSLVQGYKTVDISMKVLI